MAGVALYSLFDGQRRSHTYGWMGRRPDVPRKGPRSTPVGSWPALKCSQVHQQDAVWPYVPGEALVHSVARGEDT
jgi:hypothetical protein